MITQIKEYIQFDDFNSKDFDLYLESRDAPTPTEKEIIENIPFAQGDLDFSFMFGERFYENREITYKFKYLGSTYNERKVLEADIKRKLMKPFDKNLYETFTTLYHWIGKCKSVKVDHDPSKLNFVVEIIFSVYPFAIGINDYFDDIWDTFDFINDVANFTKFEVNGSINVLVYNSGDKSISPELVASESVIVTNQQGEQITVTNSNQTYTNFTILQGWNRLTVSGSGTISFRTKAEVLI